MESTGRGWRSCDGILHPKRLQDRCLEYFAVLIRDAVSSNALLTTSRDPIAPHRVYYYSSEYEENNIYVADEEEIRRELRHLKSYLGMEQILGPDGILPVHFCDQILAYFASMWTTDLSDALVKCVCHETFGCITKLPHCDKLTLRQDTFMRLIRHPLVELSLSFEWYQAVLSRSTYFADVTSQLIRSPSVTTLRSLSFSHLRLDAHNVSFKWLSSLRSLRRLQFHSCAVSSPLSKCGMANGIDEAPSLTVLTIIDSDITCVPRRRADNLRQLTISGTHIATNSTLLTNVLSLSNLIYLDVAKTVGTYRIPSSEHKNKDWMKKLSQLPHLKYLDVSCHVLSVDDVAPFDPPHHRMSFMGLLSTQACMRKDINSDVVAGDANEKQLLVSLQTYCGRNFLLQHALHKLYDELDAKQINTSNDDIVQALAMILERSKVDVHRIYTSASACVFHILYDDIPLEERLSSFTCRKIISVLVKSLEYLVYENKEDPRHRIYGEQAVLNIVECLCCLEYPNNVIFIYSRMAKVLVALAKCSDERVKKKAITILNSFVWQVSLEMKQMMKTYNGIKAVVDFITQKTQDAECDFVMESAWSFLWNVTDETPINCAELLDCGGLQIVIDCYEAFHESENFVNTLRNMLGALGNVAEVAVLRSRLLNQQILNIFLTVLRSISDLEVQYNISGVVVNLAMEDDSLWCTVQQPTKDSLLDVVVSCVQQWDITEQREIQYRSLLPIIRTVDCHDDRVALWGVWALANLCQIATTKYIPMFQSEGGPEAVQELRRRTKMPMIRELATKVLAISEQNMYKKARLDNISR